MQGYLEKQTSSSIFRKFQNRYFVVDRHSMVYYVKKDDYEGLSSGSKGTIDLLTCVAVGITEGDTHGKEFWLESPSRLFWFRAPSTKDRDAWLANLFVWSGAASLDAVPIARHVHVAITSAIAICESKGADVEGLFRVPGIKSVVEKLRRDVYMLEGCSGLSDPSVSVFDVGSVLKGLLRELPESILTHELIVPFTRANATADNIRDLVAKLPSVNRDILMKLALLMKTLVEKGPITKASVKSLAICMAPAFSPSVDTGLVDLSQLLSLIIYEGSAIFGYSFNRISRKDDWAAETLEREETKPAVPVVPILTDIEPLSDLSFHVESHRLDEADGATFDTQEPIPEPATNIAAPAIVPTETDLITEEVDRRMTRNGEAVLSSPADAFKPVQTFEAHDFGISSGSEFEYGPTDDDEDDQASEIADLGAFSPLKATAEPDVIPKEVVIPSFEPMASIHDEHDDCTPENKTTDSGRQPQHLAEKDELQLSKRNVEDFALLDDKSHSTSLNLCDLSASGPIISENPRSILQQAPAEVGPLIFPMKIDLNDNPSAVSNAVIVESDASARFQQASEVKSPKTVEIDTANDGNGNDDESVPGSLSFGSTATSNSLSTTLITPPRLSVAVDGEPHHDPPSFSPSALPKPLTPTTPDTVNAPVIRNSSEPPSSSQQNSIKRSATKSTGTRPISENDKHRDQYEIGVRQDQVDSLLRQLQDSNTRIAHFQRKNRAVEEKVSEQCSSIDALQDRISKLQSMNEQVSRERDEYAKDLQAAMNQLTEVRQRCQSQILSNETLKRKFDNQQIQQSALILSLQEQNRSLSAFFEKPVAPAPSKAPVLLTENHEANELVKKQLGLIKERVSGRMHNSMNTLATIESRAVLGLYESRQRIQRLQLELKGLKVLEQRH